MSRELWVVQEIVSLQVRIGLFSLLVKIYNFDEFHVFSIAHSIFHHNRKNVQTQSVLRKL